MAVYRYESCKKIIADFYRDCRPSSSDWTGDAIEWINFALGELGGGFNMEIISIDLEVVNHRTTIPCNSKAIKYIKYGTQRLPKAPVMNIDEYDRTGALYYCELRSSNIIETSFANGTIQLYYMSLAKDAEGYPLVPDGGQMLVRKYLYEYILMKWLERGNIHPVRKWDEVRSGIYARYGDGAGLLERTRTSCKFPSVNSMDYLYKSLVNLIKDDSLIDVQRFDSDSNEPIEFDESTPATSTAITYTELVESNIEDYPDDDDLTYGEIIV
jgi:hypothetical protein